jgi:glycerol uptake facilitator-like aquaporin
LRRATAEAVGTFLLADAVFGATFATRDAFAGSPLTSALVAGAVAAATLVALIFALGGASGGHFNPLITFLQWVQGDRPLPCLVAYASAQFIGGFAGVVLCRYLDAHSSASLSRPPV